MNLLADFEAHLGGAVEGMFGAMFRSPVQPAELARAASKEMARSRKLGVDKQYVANVYFVFISPRDAEALGGLVPTLEGELETYLLAFARERGFDLTTRPIVRFTVDEKLKRQGKFDIIGEQMTVKAIYDELGSVAGVTDDLEEPAIPVTPVAPEPASYVPSVTPVGVVPLPEPLSDSGANSEPARPDPWADSPPVDIAAIPVPAVAPAPTAVTAVVRRASITAPSQSEVVLDAGRTYVAGRQKTCDFPVQDANVSRQHAEIFWDGHEWNVRDLGSTNGTLVNDRPISRVTLRDGDRITLGVTQLNFRETSRMERQ